MDRAKSSPEFQLSAAVTHIAQQLGFVARSAAVDNYTSAFVRVGGATRDVPPFTVGAVVGISGTQVAEAELVPTVPAVAGPPVPSSVASITFYSKALGTNTGHLLQASAFGSRNQLWPDGTSLANQVGPSFSVAALGTQTKRFTIPAGTTDVRLDVSNSGLTFAYTLGVVGVQSSQQYFPNTPGGTAAPASMFLPATIQVDSQIDLQLDVTVISVAGTLNVRVSFLTTVEAVDVRAQVPLSVATPPFNGVNLSPTVLVDLNSALDNTVVRSNVSPAAASFLIAGIAGLRVFLLYCRFTLDNRSGAAFIAGVSVTDTVTGAVWFSAVQANPALVDRTDVNPSYVASSVGSGLTVAFSGGGANVFESLAAGWRYGTQ